MGSLNEVNLIGRLGKDPECNVTKGGQSLARFSVATDDAWTDKNGQQQERTEWHRCVAWGKLAETIAEHCNKGMQLYLKGKLATREWEKDGQKHYSTEVIVQQIVFVGSKNTSGGEKQQQRSAPPPPRAAPPPPPSQRPSGGRPPDAGANYGDGDDDIPF